MFGTERKKTFDWNFWYSLPLFFKTFSLPQIFWNRAQKWCSLPNFSALSNKKTFRENLWYSPFSCKIFLLPGLFWKTEQKFCSPTNLLGTERQNFFDWNCYHSSASFSKLFRWQIFSETHHRRIFPLPKFSALWDKKLSTKTLDTPPSFPNYFRYRNVLKHSTEGLFPYQIVRQWETKKNRLKHLILFPPLFKTFSLAEIFWKAALKSCSPTNFFGTVRQKTLDWNFWYSFHSFSKLSNWQKLSETQHRRIVPLSNFPAPWDKKLSTKTFHTPPSFPKFFRYRDFSEKQHRMFVPLPNCSALRDKNFSTETFTTPPPLFQIFSLPELLCSLKHSTERLFPYQIFRNCETKKFQGNSWYSFPLFFKAFAAKILWNTAQKDCSPIKFSGTVTQKTFRENFWYSPFSSKIFFLLPGLFWKTAQKVCSPTKLFGTERQKFFDWNFYHSSASFSNFFAARISLFSETQHRKVVPLPNFSELWDKKLPTKTLDTPPSFPKTFATGRFLKHSTEGLFPYQIVRQWETKKFDWNFWYSFPLFFKFFRCQNFSVLWNTAQKGCSTTKFFGTVRQKTSHENSWYSPFFSKNFRYRKISETQHRRVVPLPNCSAMRDKKIRLKLLILLPPLFQNFFAAGNFLKQSTERFPYQIFRHSDTKNFRLKLLILLPPLFKTFSLPEVSWKAALKSCSPTKFFGTVRQRNFGLKLLILLPLFFKTFSLPQNFLKHSIEEIVRHWEKKNFRLKLLILFAPLFQNFFAATNFLKQSTEVMFPTKFFGTVKQKNFPRKLMILPLLLQNFFATGTFLKNRTEVLFPYQLARHWETKLFRLKLLPLLRLFFKTFSLADLLWNTSQKDFSPTKIFGTVRQKTFHENSWYSPFFSKLFSLPECSETQHRRVVPLPNCSAMRDKKKSTETFDTLSPSFQNFFAGRNFLKSSTEELFTHQFFRHCKTKNFGLKLLILLPLFFKTF